MTYVTEEQAKEIQCCGPEGCGAIGPDMSRWCIGSACMAWRWGPYHDDREQKLVSTETGEPVCAGTAYNSEWVLVEPGEPAPEPRGYCGMAGRPE